MRVWKIHWRLSTPHWDGMVKGNELTVEQSAAVLTVAMKAYEVGKKARIK